MPTIKVYLGTNSSCALKVRLEMTRSTSPLLVEEGPHSYAGVLDLKKNK